MPELTDDQLDGLFRKSVEEFDTPFDPAAWQDMKARLDANDRTTPSGASTWKNLLRWGLPVALLLLLTGGSWFIYHNANSGTKTAESPKVASPGTGLTNTAKGVPPTEMPRLTTTERPDTKPVGSTEPKANEVGQVADRGETVVESSLPENRVNKSEIGLTVSKLPDENKAIKPLGVDASLAESLTKPKVSGATKSVTSTYRPSTTSTLTNRKGNMSGRKQRTVSRKLAPFSGSGYALSSTPSFTKRVRVNSQEAQTPEMSSTGSNGIVPESKEATSVVLPTIHELAIRPAHWPKSLAFTGRPVEAQPDTTAQRVTPKTGTNAWLKRSVCGIARFEYGWFEKFLQTGYQYWSVAGLSTGLSMEYSGRGNQEYKSV